MTNLPVPPAARVPGVKLAAALGATEMMHPPSGDTVSLARTTPVAMSTH